MATSDTLAGDTVIARLVALESQVRAAALRLCTIEEQLHRTNVRIAVLSSETVAPVDSRLDEEPF